MLGFKTVVFLSLLIIMIFPVYGNGYGYYQGDGSVTSTVEINSSTTNGPNLADFDQYGASVANIGDLNGDGVNDLAVGANYDSEGGTYRGAVHIHFMNTDGSIDSTVEINSSTTNGPDLADNDTYGTSVANIGDLNGDGVNDLAVGAIYDSEGGTYRGAVHIHFMNTDGSIDSTVEINSSTTNGPDLANIDYYGRSVANIGDLNGDGVNDLAVGAIGDGEGGNDRGAVHIHFMNTDGSIDSTVEINSSTTNGPNLADNDTYGTSVANIGDLNGDGVNDLAVGAYADDEGGSPISNRGAVHIHFMNTDGSIDSTVEINSSTTNGPDLADNDGYGTSAANIGDLDGDGVDDLAVGAIGDSEGGTYRGAVHIHLMNTDGSIDSTVEINSSTTNGPDLANVDYYGISAANIGDLNGDGVDDLAVGAIGDSEGGTYRGAVHIHFMYGAWIDQTPAKNMFSKDTRCDWSKPPKTTWITLEPLINDGISGIQLNWVQHSADKITIKIDDGSDTYPWKINKTSNDGHEFLPNVSTWQNIKIKPTNHCAKGDYGTHVSYNSYPLGWYGE